MKRKFVVLVSGLLFVLILATVSQAGGFIATAQNLRGAIYLGYGPTPVHASEMAVAKCSQNSFIPPSCKVVSVRMDCPPPVCAPPMPMRKPIRKANMYPAGYWGRPMP